MKARLKLDSFDVREAERRLVALLVEELGTVEAAAAKLGITSEEATALLGRTVAAEAMRGTP